MRLKPLLLTALTGLVGPAACAQIPAASQQVDSVQQRRQLDSSGWLATNTVPEQNADESSDIGSQSVLQFKPRRQFLQASADVQYFYTDNMFLVDRNKQGADVLVSTVAAALAPTPYEFYEGQLAPRLGFQEQWFNYGLANSDKVLAPGSLTPVRLDTFNFNALTVFADAAWSRQNWTFTLGGDFRQLMDSSSYHQFYQEYVPRWSVRRDFFTSKTTMLSIGYEGDYRVTNTRFAPVGEGDHFNDRTDQSLVLIGSWRLCRYVILQPSYRFQYTHFTSTTRDDFEHIFDLSLYCPITENITLRTYVSYNNLQTDGHFASSYEAFNTGIGANFNIRF